MITDQDEWLEVFCWINAMKRYIITQLIVNY